MDRLFRDLHERPDVPFGGVVVVLGGDFRQVLPVVRRGSRGAIVDASLPTSYLWDCIQRLQLTINMRVQLMQQQGRDAEEQQAFANLLLKVGQGEVGEALSIPPSMRAATQNPSDLIRTVFGDLGENGPAAARDPATLLSRALLTPRTATVLELNDRIFEGFPGQCFACKCRNSAPCLPRCYLTHALYA